MGSHCNVHCYALAEGRLRGASNTRPISAIHKPHDVKERKDEGNPDKVNLDAC